MRGAEAAAKTAMSLLVRFIKVASGDIRDLDCSRTIPPSAPDRSDQCLPRWRQRPGGKQALSLFQQPRHAEDSNTHPPPDVASATEWRQLAQMWRHIADTVHNSSPSRRGASKQNTLMHLRRLRVGPRWPRMLHGYLRALLLSQAPLKQGPFSGPVEYSAIFSERASLALASLTGSAQSMRSASERIGGCARDRRRRRPTARLPARRNNIGP
jgi:hypothetical protein